MRIVGELDLPTVFHLSRLSRRFWQLLRRDKSSQTVWRDARKRSGITKPTAPGMTVYEQANLIFGCCKVRLRLSRAKVARPHRFCPTGLRQDDEQGRLGAQDPRLSVLLQEVCRRQANGACFHRGSRHCAVQPERVTFSCAGASPARAADAERFVCPALDSSGGERKTKHYSIHELRCVQRMLQEVVRLQQIALDSYAYEDYESDDGSADPREEHYTLTWTSYGLEALSFKNKCFGELQEIRAKADLVDDLQHVNEQRVAVRRLPSAPGVSMLDTALTRRSYLAGCQEDGWLVPAGGESQAHRA